MRHDERQDGGLGRCGARAIAFEAPLLDGANDLVDVRRWHALAHTPRLELLEVARLELGKVVWIVVAEFVEDRRVLRQVDLGEEGVHLDHVRACMWDCDLITP